MRIASRRFFVSAGVLAALSFLIASVSIGNTWYVVTIDSVTVEVSGSKAWPGFQAVAVFQATAAILALFFKRLLAIVVIAINAIGSILFGWYATLALIQDNPSALETEVAKVTGIAGNYDQVQHSELRYLFLGTVIFATLLLIPSLVARISLRNEPAKSDKYQLRQSSQANDPISLWDDQS